MAIIELTPPTPGKENIIELTPAPTSGFPGASIIEPLAAIGSGLAATAAGGAAGTVAAAIPGLEPGAGEAVLEGVQERLTFQPRTEAGQAGLETLGDLIQKGVDIVNFPISGLAGITELVGGQGIDQAANTLKSVQETGVSKTLQERTFEETGSPAATATAAVIPEAVLMALSVRVPAPIRRRAEGKTARAQKAVDDIELARDAPTEVNAAQSVDDVAEIIQKGTPDEIVDIVQADKEFFRAADELGVQTEPISSFASKNPQFVDIENALRKVPGSILEKQFIDFVGDTAQQADNLIGKYGGTIDKAQLGLDFKRESLRVIDNLAEQADEAYSSIARAMPPSTRHPARETVSFILSKADEMGGVKELPGRLKAILFKLQGKERVVKRKSVFRGQKPTVVGTEIVHPTLGNIDQIRREVGQAINRGSGPFKDVEKGLNKALYARLTRDQDAIAQLSGFSGITDSAKGLIRQRKQLEDNLTVLLGKDLNQALNINVTGAIKGLGKGQIDRFNEVIRAIPKKIRGDVVISAMNDVFKGTGVGQAQLSPTQFVKWFETLNRSPASKAALFKELPTGSKKAIENLFIVSKGISQAQRATIPTGRINTLFNPETGFLRKMVGRAAPVAVAVATRSPIASVMTSATMEFLSQGTNGAKRAADLMGSPQFQGLIKKAAKDGVIEGSVIPEKLLRAQTVLEKSKLYQVWVDSLATPDKAALSAGLLTYLFQQE